MVIKILEQNYTNSRLLIGFLIKIGNFFVERRLFDKRDVNENMLHQGYQTKGLFPELENVRGLASKVADFSLLQPC